MKTPDSYLETVLISPLAQDWSALFNLRAEMRQRDTVGPIKLKPRGSRSGEGVMNAGDTGSDGQAPSTRKFVPLEEVVATLKEVEASLFDLPAEIVDDRLLRLGGHTDMHTAWWLRLRAINDARPALDKLAGENARWAALTKRLKEIIGLPQTAREAARIQFLQEIAPILSNGSIRLKDRYGLIQIYGDLNQISTFASRLLVDAPGLFECEKPFLQKFNPDVTGSIQMVRESPARARARYVPVDPEPPMRFRLVRTIMALGLVGWALWRVGLGS